MAVYNIDGINIDESEGAAQAIDYDTAVKGINHRGYNTVAPENTLPAYKLSKSHGFYYVETDVSFTSDNVAVLLHDNTINRTARNSDGTEISETINISDITYEQVLTYDFGIWKSSTYAGTKIPTLSQFLALCKNIGLYPYIELKSNGNYTQSQIQSIVDEVEKHGLKGKVTYISFSSTFLTYVKNYDSNARLGYVQSGSGTDGMITTATGLKTTGNEVFMDTYDKSDSWVEKCRVAGLPLEIWTIDSASTIQNMNPYITGVTSNSLIAGKVLYDANIT